MSIVLLIIICVIYIGLGVPDSAFGTALPAMWAELNLPISLASAVSVLISIATLLSSFFSAKLIAKLKTGKITAIATLSTAIALMGFSHAQSIIVLFLLTLPLGFGAGSIDAALNNYVALHYNSSQMSFLHSFYGIGVALSPFIFSFTLENDGNWRQGYLIIFIIQLSLAIIAFCALPLWKKLDKKDEEKAIVHKLLSYRQMAKNPSVIACWGAFFFTCSLEFTCDIWGTSYLVSTVGLSQAVSARFLTLYYVGITLGRIISGLLAIKLSCKKILTICYSLVFAGIITLFLPLPAMVKGVTLFLIGLGNGPTFPNLMSVTPRNFGRTCSQSFVSAQMVFSNAGILVMPPLFGLIAQYLSVNVFPVFILACYIFMLVSTILYDKLPKKNFDNNC